MADPITPLVGPTYNLLRSAASAMSPTKRIEQAEQKLEDAKTNFEQYSKYYSPDQKVEFWQRKRNYDMKIAQLRESAEDSGVLGGLKTLMSARHQSQEASSFHQKIVSTSRELEAQAKIREALQEAEGWSGVEGFKQNSSLIDNNGSPPAFEENTSCPTVNFSENCDINKSAAVESSGLTGGTDTDKAPSTKPYSPTYTQAELSNTGKNPGTDWDSSQTRYPVSGHATIGSSRRSHKAASGDRSEVGSSVVNPTASLPSGTSVTSSRVSQSALTNRYRGEGRRAEKQRAPAASHSQQSVTVYATNVHVHPQPPTQPQRGGPRQASSSEQYSGSRTKESSFQTTQSSYVCPVENCGKEYRTTDELARHKKARHPSSESSIPRPTLLVND
ncbi:hypothetical protein BU17DRAFT_98807 [Hysterangium stoloniferum]|nr:hypothetical protein BU17DRAFT_98807 [Hysterangium stoloniferum]